MCSIAGSNNKTEVDKMLSVMVHRAPDDAGVVFNGKFAMGMGRLKIIDLVSDGLCPYQEDNRTLVFNGEIYNYLEIRKELKALNWEFKTESDAEVLLKSYVKWGEKCLEKFNGMFSFAVYDGEQIFFARDIAGEKPLYYKEKPFKFASEAKALNWDCQEFPPAHCGIYDLKKKKLTIKRYWNLEKRDIDLRTVTDELEWLLEDSVKLRTRSDVPYALYYSGGIDSSLLNTFHNFKYKFTYKDNDNYRREFWKLFPKIVWHLDYPVEHFSPFALWKLAEEARNKKIRVVLSGEGADELFGGYVRYVKPHFNYMAQQAFPSYKTMFEPVESVTDAGWREFNGNMQVLLRIGDRMASAWGVENRCPFLDKRIIEFAYSLPDEYKINGTETKVILRRILERRVPGYKHIEKTGLFCSVNKWLGKEKEGFGKKSYMELQQKICRSFQ